MNEIRRGLESVGLATLLNANRSLMKRAFASSKDIVIKADDLLNKIKVEDPLMKPRDEKTQKQNQAVEWLKQYIKALPSQPSN